MSEPERAVKLQIAFEGGQSIAADVTEEAANALTAALAGSEAVYELQTEGETFVVALAKVVYVRRSARETRIGFAASA